MSDDERLEAGLRATLARRDPGTVPPHLESAVVARLRATPRVAWWMGLRRPLTGAATLVAIAIIAVVAVSLGSLRMAGPAASATPAPVDGTFGLAPGDGITSGDFAPVLQMVTWVVVFGGVVRLVVRSRRRVFTVAGTLAGVGLVWVAANIGTSDAIVETGMVGAIDPYQAAVAATEYDVTIALDGDQPFRSILVLQNGSRLPLTLRGMVAPANVSDPDPPLAPRLVGFGAIPENEYIFDHVRPFAPVTVEPGGLVNVVLLGMSGACSVSHTGPDAGSQGLSTVRLVYDQLSMLHTQDVRLTRTMTFPARFPCPPVGSSSPAP